MRSVVVLPTYNEAENIALFLRAVREAAPTTNVLVVDDNSPDGTGRIADEIGAELGGVEVMHRAGKEGLGSAYREGFARVLGGDYDVVLSMDADFSHDPSQIVDFIARIEGGADLVIGSRYVSRGRHDRLAGSPPVVVPVGQRLHPHDPRGARTGLHQRVSGLPGRGTRVDRPDIDVGGGIRIPDRTGTTAGTRWRGGRRGADHLP
jgi:glycosyltransferase involved in cell wall biosynthesis